ncbi:MAG: transposase [Candidatus Paceibacterota bacterium]
MERKFIFSIDEFYHVYNRGIEKRKIFVKPADYERFIKLLYLCNGTEPIVTKLVQGLPPDDLFSLKVGNKIVDIGAYCLMPNHFHLLLKERVENGISIFMLKLLTGYSMYFNKKYKRTGQLFEGTFKANHLGDDNYLKYMYAYIHLNPIKLIDSKWKERGINNAKKAKSYLLIYKYSSYLDYITAGRAEGRILNKRAFPEYFSGKKEFKDFTDDWLNYKDEGEEVLNIPTPRITLGK